MKYEDSMGGARECKGVHPKPLDGKLDYICKVKLIFYVYIIDIETPWKLRVCTFLYFESPW